MDLVRLSILLLCLSFFMCQDNNHQNVEVTQKQLTEIKILGDSLAVQLLDTLQTELLAAIKAGGLQSAVEVCDSVAIPITQRTKPVNKYEVDIKRVSERFRNPQNKPDDMAMLALSRLENDKLDSFVQTINESGFIYYRYYKPLRVKPLCVNCHGSPQAIGSEVAHRINKLYPEDRAINYNVGDFRGAVMVTLLPRNGSREK